MSRRRYCRAVHFRSRTRSSQPRSEVMLHSRFGRLALPESGAKVSFAVVT